MSTAGRADPNFWKHEWPKTDSNIANVPSWIEILSGGPLKDGIPTVSGATFIPVAQESGIDDRDPVITLKINVVVARAYPILYLKWHKIVDDVVGGVPVAVTFARCAIPAWCSIGV
jgi:hypothetical protein